MKEHPAEFDPRKYLEPSRDAMKQIIKERYIKFGSAGHAFDYKPITLKDMRKFYENE
jgi:fructose-bisphosphate aldolase class II